MIDLHMTIEGCIQNNRVSQKDLFRHFYGYAAAICNRYVSNKEDLVEVVNDGFIKVFRELDKFDTNVNNVETRLKAWIRSIMIHTSIDYFRSKNKLNVSLIHSNDDVEEMEQKAESPIDKISYNELIEIINQLSPVYKIVFNLSIIDGMTHAEIAKTINISEGTSKSNLFKARQIVIKIIQEKYKVTPL